MRASHGIILCALGLLAFGVVMVTSAGLSVGVTSSDAQSGSSSLTIESILTGRTAQLAGLSALALLAGALVPIRRIAHARPFLQPALYALLAGFVLLILVHVPGIGREMNGARRWIQLGPIGFQPSEIVKWALPVALAWYAARRPLKMGRFFSGFFLPMAIAGFLCLMIATEDLGTAVLIGMVSVIILVAAGARLLHAGLLLPAGAAAIVVLIRTSPYRVDRIRAFLDPFADPQDTGYHMLQSMAAVSGGGLPGRGLGNGLQKFGYLPEDTTDFLYAIVCEELGLAGAAMIICLFAVLLLCGRSVLLRTVRPFDRLVCLGVLATIGLQAAINLLVVTGLAPTKGIALPLVSSGGTGWCLTAFSLGLLVAIDRQADQADLVPADPHVDPPANSPARAVDASGGALDDCGRSPVPA